MIIWDYDIPEFDCFGKYLVCSIDEFGNYVYTIEYWDGYSWDNIRKDIKPIKWVMINI